MGEARQVADCALNVACGDRAVCALLAELNRVAGGVKRGTGGLDASLPELRFLCLRRLLRCHLGLGDTKEDLADCGVVLHLRVVLLDGFSGGGELAVLRVDARLHEVRLVEGVGGKVQDFVKVLESLWVTVHGVVGGRTLVVQQVVVRCHL